MSSRQMKSWRRSEEIVRSTAGSRAVRERGEGREGEGGSRGR